jgi:hypothetical protein
MQRKVFVIALAKATSGDHASTNMRYSVRKTNTPCHFQRIFSVGAKRPKNGHLNPKS